MGVTRGLAGIKFSASPRMFGIKSAIKMSDIINKTNPTISLYV